MEAFLNILWLLGICLSIDMVFQFVGHCGITRMFPEGKRWWHVPASLAALAFFAFMVLINPFM